MSVTLQRSASRAHLLGSVSCAGVLALSLTAPSLAAEAESGSPAVALETVTVSAQRREENLQAVPIAINTVSGEELATRGALDVRSLTGAVPNLSTTGSGNMNVYVRGVGVTSSSPNNEPSAATYVDGVYLGSAIALSQFPFNNVERVEVLKGPQGTLFGRNATAGVIQIITPDPKQDFGGNVDLSYGNYETVTAHGYMTGGLTDNLAADISVLYEDQGAGWGTNLTHDKEIFLHHNFAVRSKWLYTPTDSTKIGLAFDYSRFRSDGSNHEMVSGSVNSTDNVTTYVGRYNTVGDLLRDDPDLRGASIRVDQELGSLHGVSITSFRHLDGDSTVDGDTTPAVIGPIELYTDADYVTQEFQLSNGSPGRVQWLVGAFFFGNDVESFRVFTGSSVAGGRREAFGRQKTQSYSAFAQATAEVFADTKLTLGLRYTDETLKNDGFGRNAAGVINAGPFNNEIDFDPLTWRIALDHQFTPDVLAYVSHNHGFKSGGYNLGNPGSAPFFPETLDAYEVGVKSEFMENRVRLNVAVFYYDYKNLQVAVVPGNGIQIFTNAAAARNYGLDAGLDVAATDNLTLSFGLGLLDARFTDYPNAQSFTNRGVRIPIANAKGNSLPFAPPLSGYVSANYKRHTVVGEFKGTVSVSHNDRSYVTPDEGMSRPAYELVNASVEWWTRTDGAYGVRLWGRNLTNSYFPNDRIASNRGWYEMAAPPRTYGLTLMKSF